MMKTVTARYSACIFSILLMLVAFPAAQQARAATSGPAEEEAAEPCTAEEIQLDVQVNADVTYVSGGIGICESREMQRIAPQYQLELVFVRKTARSEAYLASIPVTITDSKGNQLLETVSNGPYLLANMANGHYVMSAEYGGIRKTQSVQISNKHQRLVFVWVVE